MNDIVISTQHLPQSVEDMKAQVQSIQELMATVMKKDVHYGQIKGVNGTMLFKPGAEVLMTAFRISVLPEIIDLSSPDEIRVRILAKGVHMTSDICIGVGLGEASTNEEKYKWRFGTDSEYENTPENRRRIKYGWKWGQQRGERIDNNTKQVRTNPADLANTILKMAKKRALVDLALTSLAASDVFEQNYDSKPDAQNQDTPVHEKPEPFVPTSEPPPRDPGEPVYGSSREPEPPSDKQEARKEFPGQASAAQIKMLQAKTRNANLDEMAVFSRFHVTSWDSIKMADVDVIIRFIEEMKA